MWIYWNRLQVRCWISSRIYSLYILLHFFRVYKYCYTTFLHELARINIEIEYLSAWTWILRISISVSVKNIPLVGAYYVGNCIPKCWNQPFFCMDLYWSKHSHSGDNLRFKQTFRKDLRGMNKQPDEESNRRFFVGHSSSPTWCDPSVTFFSRASKTPLHHKTLNQDVHVLPVLPNCCAAYVSSYQFPSRSLSVVTDIVFNQPVPPSLRLDPLGLEWSIFIGIPRLNCKTEWTENTTLPVVRFKRHFVHERWKCVNFERKLKTHSSFNHISSPTTPTPSDFCTASVGTY